MKEFVRKYRWLFGALLVLFILANTAVFAFMIQIGIILFGLNIPYWVTFVASVIFMAVIAVVIRANE